MCGRSSTILFGILALWLLGAGPIWAFDEGIEYRITQAPQASETPGSIEVVEFFAYSCPHCFHLEPKLNEWRKRMPKYIAFRRIPVVFDTNGFLLVKAFYTAEILGITDQIHTAIFKAIHEDRQLVNTEDDLAALFAAQGVDRAKFFSAFTSFGVDTKVRKAGQISSALDITGVPALLVGGKYITAPHMTGTIDTTFQVIDELAAQLALEQHIDVTPTPEVTTSPVPTAAPIATPPTPKTEPVPNLPAAPAIAPVPPPPTPKAEPVPNPPAASAIAPVPTPPTPKAEPVPNPPVAPAIAPVPIPKTEPAPNPPAAPAIAPVTTPPAPTP